MGSKTTTKTSGTATQSRGETADTQATRKLVNEGVDYTTPIVGSFGQAENDIENTFYAEDLNDGAKQADKASRMFNLRQQKGLSLSNAKGAEHAFKTNASMNFSNMMSPTNSSHQGTQTTHTPFNPMQLIAPAIGAGASIATGGASGAGSLMAKGK